MDILKIFQYALLREQEGKRFFEQYAQRLSHASAVEVFMQLAVEEQKHIDFVQAQIHALEKGQNPLLEEIQGLAETGFFSQRSESEMIDQTTAEAMVPDLPVLRMAVLIERDFAEYYEMMASKATGEAKEALLLLAHWERVHENLFKRMHDQAFEQYAQMPWGG